MPIAFRPEGWKRSSSELVDGTEAGWRGIVLDDETCEDGCAAAAVSRHEVMRLSRRHQQGLPRVTKTVLTASSSLILLMVACTGRPELGHAQPPHERGESGQPAPAGLPANLGMVAAPVGDELWLAIRNDGPGVARIPAALNLYRPFKTVALEVSPLPDGATTQLTSAGYVMPAGQLDSFIDLPPKRMYGTSYSLTKLAESMRLPPGCYTFIARYQDSSGVKNAPRDVAPSRPVRMCL